HLIRLNELGIPTNEFLRKGPVIWTFRPTRGQIRKSTRRLLGYNMSTVNLTRLLDTHIKIVASYQSKMAFVNSSVTVKSKLKTIVVYIIFFFIYKYVEICLPENHNISGKDIKKDTQNILNRMYYSQQLQSGASGVCTMQTAKDCSELQKYISHSDVYPIYPDESEAKVYCDMTTDGGGWTIIQRRLDGSINFQRNWKDYENGFGNVDGEYWLGNKHIHSLTSSGKYELRIDLTDMSNTKTYAVYKKFVVGDAASKYKLTVGINSGDAGDKMSYHNGMKFSTTDQDNDQSSGACKLTIFSVHVVKGSTFSSINIDWLNISQSCPAYRRSNLFVHCLIIRFLIELSLPIDILSKREKIRPLLFVYLRTVKHFCLHLRVLNSDLNMCCLLKKWKCISILLLFSATSERESPNRSHNLEEKTSGVCTIQTAKDCSELQKYISQSDVYPIYPDEFEVKVYCDMTTDGGGWTIIQRRLDGSVNFQRNWKDYENGFGNVDGEYWLGNKHIHSLTSNDKYELRIDLTDLSNTKKYAVYKTFIIGDAASKYKLTIGEYSGNAGDQMKNHNEMKFSSTDQDNDKMLSIRNLTSTCIGATEGTRKNSHTSLPILSYRKTEKHIEGERKRDCGEIAKSNRKATSGVYTIFPDKRTSMRVSCNMDTVHDAWTIIQRKLEGTVNFQRTWKDYENGFGDPSGEYWIGNKHIHSLTSSGKCELKIDLTDLANTKKFAVYKTFLVGDAASKYKLTIGEYSGNAGDKMAYHNGMKFSTIDQDNDENKDRSFAKMSGAWWHNNCRAHRTMAKIYFHKEASAIYWLYESIPLLLLLARDVVM
ncbi:Hypothetical predicted protein, partial [Mytilus galloprovincialis]